MTPRFSIIIPAYNVADYISTCINSVLNQDFSDWEAIIINDGSTDSTAQILKRYHDPRLKIFRQKNAGLSAARNAGIAQASGEYLLLLDGDDFLAPSALAVLDRELSGEKPDLLRFQIQDFHENGNLTPHPETPFPAMPGPAAFPRLAAYHYTENAWSYLYRTDFFKSHNFQYAPGRIAEDFGLTPLIIAQAATIKSIAAICYNYRQRAGSIMNDPAKLKTRVRDSFAQLQSTLPQIAAIPATAPITHYLVASFLTLAAQLPYSDFKKYYKKSKRAHFLRYLHPSSPKSLPRTLLAKFLPCQFYRHYHLAEPPIISHSRN